MQKTVIVRLLCSDIYKQKKIESVVRTKDRVCIPFVPKVK